jgi:hypothetical protein
VVWLDNLSTGKRKISDVENEIELYEADLLDLDALQHAVLITSFMKQQSPLFQDLWRLRLASVARMSTAR